MKPLRPGQQISRRQYNAVTEQARRVSQLRGGSGSFFRTTNAGVQVDSQPEGFWAWLTASPDDAGGGSGSGDDDAPGYGWEEIVADGQGGWFVLAVGRKGTPTANQAYEVNGLDVPLTINGHNTVVWMRPALRSNKYLFEWPAGTETDGGSGDGSGSGLECEGGVPVSELIRCDNGGQLRSACLRIVNGRLALVAGDGTILAGG